MHLPDNRDCVRVLLRKEALVESGPILFDYLILHLCLVDIYHTVSVSKAPVTSILNFIGVFFSKYGMVDTVRSHLNRHCPQICPTRS